MPLDKIIEESNKINFRMSCTETMGSLLTMLATSKPGGRFLEIGTGTGVSAYYIKRGMNDNATLTSLDINNTSQQIAIDNIVCPNVDFINRDATLFIEETDLKFDMIFADFRPGKFNNLLSTLNLLKTGGIYIVDDLLPQTTWPHDHQERVDIFIKEINMYSELISIVHLNYDSGILIASKK
jgi:predicted O-methyltransferase YrrM